jgi:prepilin-type N-terminal cleavage/methylation domain-containing protein/prepilin-type processing-associated H-X9-DG protein
MLTIAIPLLCRKKWTVKNFHASLVKETPMKTTGKRSIAFRVASLEEHLLCIQSRGAFTLIELFVVIAVIAILAVTLLPALAASKDRDRRAQCANNLRQICIATFTYAADNNDYMPPLKWRGLSGSGANLQYPHEMFRYSSPNIPVNGTNSTYTSDGGPYDLGFLWKSGVPVDGKIYYCPADLNNNDNLTYSYYSQTTNWPWGVNAVIAANSNPGYVRSGYCYYPQSRATTTVVTSGLGAKQVPVWPLYSTAPNPYKTWICVPLFKQTEIDQTKSIVVDAIYLGLAQITHKSGNTSLGLNAGFGDGHVAWQGINQNKNGFNAIEWASIASQDSSSVQNFMFVQSCWQP